MSRRKTHEEIAREVRDMVTVILAAAEARHLVAMEARRVGDDDTAILLCLLKPGYDADTALAKGVLDASSIADEDCPVIPVAELMIDTHTDDDDDKEDDDGITYTGSQVRSS